MSLASGSTLTSYVSSRRGSLKSNAYADHFTLQRPPIGSVQSSAVSLSKHQQFVWPEQDKSNHNDEWDFVAKSPGRPGLMSLAGLSGGPPSLVSSETSVTTGEPSPHSSQSSLRSSVPPTKESRTDALRQYYKVAHRRSSMEQNYRSPTSLPGPPVYKRPAPRRASSRHPSILHATNNIQGYKSSSFLPQTQNEVDNWGQFVDTEDAEEDLVRRSKVLSIKNHYASSYASLRLRA